MAFECSKEREEKRREEKRREGERIEGKRRDEMRREVPCILILKGSLLAFDPDPDGVETPELETISIM